jgi:hypothetical protein
VAVVEQETKENVTKKSTWLRFLYIIVFAILFYIALLAIFVVVTIQFITKLFTGDVHQRLQEFGDSAAEYVAQLIRYLTFHSDDLPYPFGDWPKGKAPRRKKARKKKATSEPEEPKEEAAPSAASATPASGAGGTDTPASSGGAASS